MNQVRQQPPQPRTVEQEREVAASDLLAYESTPHQHEGNGSMYAVRYPDGHTALVSESNLRGALACGGTVAPRIHILG